jgi:hypothetical protein
MNTVYIADNYVGDRSSNFGMSKVQLLALLEDLGVDGVFLASLSHLTRPDIARHVRAAMVAKSFR